MQPIELLYLIIAVCVAVLTIALIWLINDLVKLSRSLRRSSDDVAVMTKEVKEKVLLVTEAMDRVGTLASHFIGIIEEAESQIREKSARIADSLGAVLGVSEMIKSRKAKKAEDNTAEDESESEKTAADESVEPAKSAKDTSATKKSKN